VNVSSLVIFDVSNPAAPSFAKFIPEGGRLGQPGVWGNYVYVPEPGIGLLIFNQTTISNLTQVGQVRATQAAWVATAGGYAYVANGNDGLRIFTLTNPVAPVNIGHGAVTKNGAVTVRVAGDYAYVGETRGIEVYDVSNPSLPVEVASTSTSDWAGELRVVGDYIYAACSTDGFRIFRMMPQLQLALNGTNNLSLTWPATVAQFSLQQNSDLTMTNWTAVTNTVVLQGKQNQVVLSQPTVDTFYRLQPANQ
jgi:hypothetical protein